MDASKTNLGAYLPTSTDQSHQTESHTAALISDLQGGKNLVITGSVVCIAGIVIYCMSLVSGDFGLQDTAYLKAGLAVMGSGFVCWLLGAIKYLNAAIDSDSSDEIF